jgi:hypothetical protein
MVYQPSQINLAIQSSNPYVMLNSVDTLNVLEAMEKAQWIKEGNKNAVIDRKKEREAEAAKKANKDKRDKKQTKEEAEASRYGNHCASNIYHH